MKRTGKTIEKSNIQLHTRDYITGSTLCQVYNPQMIKIKDLTNGYTIEYDEGGFMKQFHLLKDGVSIKEADKQSELEEYLGRISKADSKFKQPIRAFYISYAGEVEVGSITSANLIDNSFWFTLDVKSGYRDRRKETIGSKYHELTDANTTILGRIKNLRDIIRDTEMSIKKLESTLEHKIDADFIKTRQGT